MENPKNNKRIVWKKMFHLVVKWLFYVLFFATLFLNLFVGNWLIALYIALVIGLVYTNDKILKLAKNAIDLSHEMIQISLDLEKVIREKNAELENCKIELERYKKEVFLNSKKVEIKHQK